jgi:putative lipoic acid-binding regulatory protein
MTDKHEQFKRVLDECHEWPCPYLYKFILPTKNLSQFVDLFPENTIETRESKNGKYTSITMQTHMASSKEVMDVYTKASQIPDLMSL